MQPDDNIKLIAIDLDGTLFDNNRNLSPANVEAIHRAQAEGVIIILASGRPPFGVLPAARKLDLGGYLIAYNGSMLMDANIGTIIYNRPLLPQDTHAALRMIRKYDLYVSLHCGMEFYADTTYKELNWEEGVFSKKQIFVKDLILDAPAEPNKLEVTTLDGDKRLESLWMDLVTEMPQIRLHHQKDFYLELTHQGASKETALALACGLHGILPRNAAAIGNAMNDAGMLGFAGLSIAVGNSVDYLKEAADWVVASNNEDGVAEAIHRILDNRINLDRTVIPEKQAALNEPTRGSPQ
jgi:Cof subfamily protein (haloacid dehalogenase superfamily)